MTFQTMADGLCMVRLILLQVIHHPTAYMPEMAMCQMGMYMLCHPSHYYKYVEEDLLYTGESYESFIYNLQCIPLQHVGGRSNCCSLWRHVEYRHQYCIADYQKTVPFIPQQKSTRCCVSMQWQ